MTEQIVLNFGIIVTGHPLTKLLVIENGSDIDQIPFRIDK